MHLLAARGRAIDDGDTAVDLELPPADIVFLSSADSELAALSRARALLPSDGPSLATVNLMRLGHPMSVDLFIDGNAGQARLVVVRVLGGAGYWSYGLEELRALARRGGPSLAVVPGEDRWDPALEVYGTIAVEDCRRIWRYLVEAGAHNSENCVRYFGHLTGHGEPPPAAIVLPRAGYYLPGNGHVTGQDVAAVLAGQPPPAVIVFYRSALHGGSTEPIDRLAGELSHRGLPTLPVFVASLKDRESAAFLEQAFDDHPPAIVLNTTAFAVSLAGAAHTATVLDRPGRPVLQVVLSGSSEHAWRDNSRGLSPRDLPMNVVLPEIDGRILTRPVSFKEEVSPGPGAPTIAVYRSQPDRARFVAEQAAAWVGLASRSTGQRKIALILSNYPDRDGRIGNGVGLDTPESAVRLVHAMIEAGYDGAGFPDTGGDLMKHLLAGRTNASPGKSSTHFGLDAHRRFLDTLAAAARQAIEERWGPPEDDPACDRHGFGLAVHRFGNIAIAIQPPRGYGVDPKQTYHDPDLVPPHGYLAFYAWLREVFRADAMVHLGKHGNLEWLPGKAVGLSETCWPEITLGATPLIYPFIVNDPGEGSQAKRRASAVIIDHLIPAMTRAETHGGLARLETLIDEFFLADGLDSKRRDYLAGEIISVAEELGLDRDLDLTRADTDGSLQSIDAHICDLKEMQIRDGLHILGSSPGGRLRRDTLVAIARVPRSGNSPQAASLNRAIAGDLKLDFDPLDCEPAKPWTGPCSPSLTRASPSPWRTQGDTVERIEALAAELVETGARRPEFTRTNAVLDWIADDLAPSLDRSGVDEIGSLLKAMDGRFVPPGPSGAPTRGRPDVLPTGRNFYSVDVRSVPTEAAWTLGRKSADALALRYFHDEGAWPRSIAMSAWATSNMRTGGDDIAHVLALIGARPVWESGTGRVTGFEVIPLSELRRPRIDVTLRISGMFRDAFPVQIDLIDSAMRQIADLDEDEDANPIAAAVRATSAGLRGAGLDVSAARVLAGSRIYGAKPGAYGAGLQTLIDHGAWETRKDFAAAFLAWGGFAYGAGRYGDRSEDLLAERLSGTDTVFHAQDNREHDILDSDDYYQFQGGLAATVETLSGKAPAIYHGDSSRPENPTIRSLGQEIARVVRGRAANPKWIAGVMRHGYKGGFEMAATVDYLFAFAATTDAVGDHHFDQLFDAYLEDDDVSRFLAANNPAALAEIAGRFREAIDRGLWAPRSNSAYDRLSRLINQQQEASP